jgi:tripartite-type tricarboxylate transporter receptor subunit TctC
VLTLRSLLAPAIVGAILFGVAPASAQDYPTRPIRILVPAAPGGIGDILPRMFGAKLAESNHTVIVENRTGGGGMIAADAVAKAEPDGYLLVVGNQGMLAIRPQLGKLPYDTDKDLAPIVLLVTVPNILIAHPSVPFKTVPELVAYAKANPGKLTYASQGVGASGHIAGELLKQAAGIDITHVPYRGAAPAAQALAAGHVDLMFDVVSLALGAIRGGAVRAIAVASPERVSLLPDVPTMAEGGYPMEVGAWFGLLAPGATPAPIIGWLNQAAHQAFAAPDMRARFVSQGAAMPLGTPEQFRAFIAAQTARFGEVIRRAGIKTE